MKTIFDRETARQRYDAAQQRCAAMRAKPSVNLATLPADRKRAVWEHLKTHHPEVADLLTDPHVQDIRATFDAEVLIGADLLQGIFHEQPD